MGLGGHWLCSDCWEQPGIWFSEILLWQPEQVPGLAEEQLPHSQPKPHRRQLTTRHAMSAK